MNEGDRYRLYQRLLKAAAKQLNCRVTDDKAKDLACLRLMRETVTLKLIAGKDCDPSSLRWLIEELARFSPPPEAKVDIGFVENVTGIFTCQYCHKRNEPRTLPWPRKRHPKSHPRSASAAVRSIRFIDLSPLPTASVRRSSAVAITTGGSATTLAVTSRSTSIQASRMASRAEQEITWPTQRRQPQSTR